MYFVNTEKIEMRINDASLFRKESEERKDISLASEKWEENEMDIKDL